MCKGENRWSRAGTGQSESYERLRKLKRGLGVSRDSDALDAFSSFPLHCRSQIAGRTHSIYAHFSLLWVPPRGYLPNASRMTHIGAYNQGLDMRERHGKSVTARYLLRAGSLLQTNLRTLARCRLCAFDTLPFSSTHSREDTT